jgi:hypothetical protein
MFEYDADMSYGQLTTTRETASDPVPGSDIDRLRAMLSDDWGPGWEPGTDIDMATEFPELATLVDSSDRVPGVPVDLDDMPPGPVLAAFLLSIDVGEVSGFDQITVLRAHQRMASHHQARMYTAMAAVTDTLDREYGDPDSVIDDAAQDAAV